MLALREKYKALSLPVKASLWFLVCGIIQKGISSITTPIFTRLMTVEQYGQYSIFQSWMLTIAVFATLRLSYGVYMQGLVKFEDDSNRFSSSMQGLSTVAILFVFGVYLCFHQFWNRITGLSTPLTVLMFLSIWATEAFDFWSSRQRVAYKYKALVFVTLAVALSKSVGGVIAVLYTPDIFKVEARIITAVGVELLVYSGLYFAQFKKCGIFCVKKYWKYALLFNLPLIPHYLSQTILNQADRLMIKALVGTDKAGIYSLAYSIAMLMVIINTAALNTLNPWIYRHIKDKSYKEIGYVSYTMLGLIAVTNLILILAAPEIIFIFAPGPYYEAIWVIPPLAMGNFFMFMYSLFAAFEFYFEKTKFIMEASVGAAVFNVILNYICIKKFGYLAAGYTTLICYMFYSFGHYVFMKKTCRENIGKIKIYNVKILLLLIASFMGIGFLFTALYSFFLWRIFSVLLILGLGIIYRKKITGFIKRLRVK